jgi:negative regulator of sigma E activity
MAAVVVLIVILIFACLLYRRKQKKENTPDTGNIQNAAFEGDTQPGKPSSEIPYSDYEEPAKLAQPDSSTRVPVDENDQSLNTEDYAQLDISKRTPIDANY